MNGRWKYGVVAILAIAQSLWLQPAAWIAHLAPPPRRPCIVKAHAQLTSSPLPGGRLVRLRVQFPTTCGRTARAFYEHPAPFTPTTEVGGSVRDRHSASTVFSRDPAYCRLGWEYQRHHEWHEVVLRRRGMC